MTLRTAALVAGLALGSMSGAAKAAPIVFSYTGAFQSYTIGVSGLYEIIAYGAQGGVGNGGVGGRGAAIGGEFTLTKNQVLSIAVGGQGGAGPNGGGGGGTFVTLQSSLGRAADTPLVIAGGGGGASRGDGRPGLDTPNGVGNGGMVATGTGGQGGGGGGFLTDGEDAQEGYAFGGKSYINGLAGGAGDEAGGFGGGGGASNSFQTYSGSGGAGGGFSGGNAGYEAEPGDGGGSFLSALAINQIIAASGFNPGDGYVTLEYAMSPVPLPASAPLFGVALLGLAGLGYAAKRKKTVAAA